MANCWWFYGGIDQDLAGATNLWQDSAHTMTVAASLSAFAAPPPGDAHYFGNDYFGADYCGHDYFG